MGKGEISFSYAIVWINLFLCSYGKCYLFTSYKQKKTKENFHSHDHHAMGSNYTSFHFMFYVLLHNDFT
jgi:hypothetical protein